MKLQQLQDLYDAEMRLVDALPKMADLLQQTLDEEGGANKTLTEIAALACPLAIRVGFTLDCRLATRKELGRGRIGLPLTHPRLTSSPPGGSGDWIIPDAAPSATWRTSTYHI